MQENEKLFFNDKTDESLHANLILIILINNIKSFKNNSDKFWQNEDVKFKWKANV